MKYVTFDSSGALSSRLIGGVCEIPADAVEVDEALWIRITQETDGVWCLEQDGQITKQSLPVAEPDHAAIERQWRDNELLSVMWLRERHRDQLEIEVDTTLSRDQFKALLVYMQALRDWPQSPQFPDREHRPVALPWLAQQQEAAHTSL